MLGTKRATRRSRASWETQAEHETPLTQEMMAPKSMEKATVGGDSMPRPTYICCQFQFLHGRGAWEHPGVAD